MTIVQVAVPHTRAFEGAFLDSMISCQWPEFYFDRIEGQSIADARNRLVRNFLQAPWKPDYLLFIDSDATWHPQAVQRLLSAYTDHDLRAMITACIYHRGLPPVPTWGTYQGVNDAGDHVYNFGTSIKQILSWVKDHGITTDTPNALCHPDKENRLAAIDGCGMHFCMIPREILETVSPPWFEAVDNAGEDFYFCRKVKAAGFAILCDLSVHTGHIVGPGFDYGLREMLAFHQHTEQFPEETLWNVGP